MRENDSWILTRLLDANRSPLRLKTLYVVRRVSGITSQINSRPVAATVASPVKAILLPNLSLT
jgi:hypothetical protein